MPGGSKIDPATGRRRRDKVISGRGRNAPKRWNGAIVPKGRLAFKRDKAKGKGKR
jgi:hypothetical protein